MYFLDSPTKPIKREQISRREAWRGNSKFRNVETNLISLCEFSYPSASPVDGKVSKSKVTKSRRISRTPPIFTFPLYTYLKFVSVHVMSKGRK